MVCRSENRPRVRPNASVQLQGTGWDKAAIAADQYLMLAHDLTPVDNVLRVASVHDQTTLRKAELLNLDAAVAGPVLATATHPGQAPMGWPAFQELAASTPMPVYAIGGLSPAEKPDAFAHYAQGVCGISAYWRR